MYLLEVLLWGQTMEKKTKAGLPLQATVWVSLQDTSGTAYDRGSELEVTSPNANLSLT